MSMLAEPRRKQKVINLRAKNSAWSNDSNKFGQRMLEKMGWSSGKGLGAKENGIVEHVIAKYKNDEKGLGFEDRNDQWTKHEDDFNALLANLTNGDSNEEKLHSGISLEEKSKKSKARVHYHKFTRGKDLTRYSEKDLANIFGKKSLKNKDKIEEPMKDDNKKSEQIFTEKGSMEDYFKNKLAALKSNKVTFNSIEKDDYEADYNFQGFAGTTNLDAESDDRKAFVLQGFSFYNSIGKSNNKTKEREKTKKKSKKKEMIDNVNESNYENSQDPETIDNYSVEECEPVKKKKLKKKTQEPEMVFEHLQKKPKRKKKHDVPSSDKAVEVQTEENYHVPKKKKKRKNKNHE